jgi:hypothetical protein
VGDLLEAQQIGLGCDAEDMRANLDVRRVLALVYTD